MTEAELVQQLRIFLQAEIRLEGDMRAFNRRIEVRCVNSNSSSRGAWLTVATFAPRTLFSNGSIRVLDSVERSGALGGFVTSFSVVPSMDDVIPRLMAVLAAEQKSPAEMLASLVEDT